MIELIWTITPAAILIAIAFPSFKLLYLLDEVVDPAMTLKAIGHQWYWSIICDLLEQHSENITLLSASAILVRVAKESITNARLNYDVDSLF